MTILIIPSWFPTKANPVRGSFITEQAIALNNSGHSVIIGEVEFVPIKKVIQKGLYRIKIFDIDGIRKYKIVVPSLGSETRKKWFERSTTFYRKLILYILRNEKVDIIHTHAFVPAATAVANIKDEIKIPIVYTEHYSGVQVGLNDYYKQALIKAMKKSDKVCAVSHSLKNCMLGYYENCDIEVIPNILGNDFKYLGLSPASDTIKVISVGGLIASKRHDLTIRAFHEVFNRQQATLTIVGQGVEKDNLVKLVDELGETDRVIFTGQKSRTEVAELMNQSSFFVLPSAHETFGVVYIEAMACGLPVIGTRCGGFDEIYFEGCGEIIDVDDYDAYCEAFKIMIASIKKYDRKRISQFVHDKYGEEAFVDAIMPIYRGLI